MEHKYQSCTKRVRFSDARKISETSAMAEIQGQYPIFAYGFRQSVISPNHECMWVEFLARFEDDFLRFIVELIPSVNYPYEEPAAVVLEPDLRGLPPGLHTYRDPQFEGRLICTHLSTWDPRSSLMKFFLGAVNPWANNFLAWVITEGIWIPEKWFTKEGD